MLGTHASWHFEDNPKAAIYIPAYWTAWNATLLGYFNTIIAAAQNHPTMTFLVAVNINNGPGSSAPSPTDTTYLKIQEMLAQPNIVVIGYVGTNYGSELTKAEYPVGNPFPGNAPRDLQSVKNDCTNWVSWYHVRGFMFDDQADGLTIANVPGYPGGIKEVYNAFYIGRHGTPRFWGISTP